MATFDVYLVRYKALPAFHDAVYVETKKDEGGLLYHLIGDSSAGYRFQRTHTNRPENSQSFYAPKLYKGKLIQADLYKVNDVCRQVPAEKEEIIGGVSFAKDCRHWVHGVLKELCGENGLLKP